MRRAGGMGRRDDMDAMTTNSRLQKISTLYYFSKNGLALAQNQMIMSLF